MNPFSNYIPDMDKYPTVMLIIKPTIALIYQEENAENNHAEEIS